MSEPEVVLLGTRGPFTRACLAALLRHGGRVRALLVPGPPRRAARPVAAPGRVLLDAAADAVTLAHARGIPVVEVGDPFAPWPDVAPAGDALVVACWPWRVTGAWRARFGLAVNVHPSLLPAWRGPAPLFWQMRDGARETGVTVHALDDGLDTGPVLAAQPLPIGVEDDLDRAEERLAGAGGALVARVLAAPSVESRPQDEVQASRQGWPTDADRALDAGWPVERAWRFLGALGRWGPFAIRTAAGEVTAHARVAWTAGATLDVAHRGEPDGATTIRFADGVITVR